MLAEDAWFGLKRFAPLAARLRTGVIGRLFALGGALAAFFLASYTGVLLSATNQPIWSNTTWTGALFLASAVSTGVAAIVLADRWLKLDVAEAAIKRLETLDSWAMVLELILLAIFALSLGRLAIPAFRQWPGVLVPGFVVPVGLFAPLFLKQIHSARLAELACLLVLLGGFVLRQPSWGFRVPFIWAHHH